MFEIIICDDDDACLEQTCQLVNDWKAAISTPISVKTMESGDKLLEYCAKNSPDVILLDIMMPLLNGMDAARELRKMDTDCMLVFTTTSTDHALEGFQVRAMHYLVKPFSAEELERLTDEMLVRMPYPDKCMVLKVDGSDIRLGFHNIIYAEGTSFYESE